MAWPSSKHWRGRRGGVRFGAGFAGRGQSPVHADQVAAVAVDVEGHDRMGESPAIGVQVEQGVDEGVGQAPVVPEPVRIRQRQARFVQAVEQIAAAFGVSRVPEGGGPRFVPMIAPGKGR